MACPGSISLTEGLPDTSGPDALAGTLCHEVAERALVERWTPAAVQKALIAKKLDTSVLSLADATNTIMGYVGYVLARYDALCMLWGDENVQLLVEAKVTIEGEECYGTLDSAIIWPEGVEVIDLKTGSGHAVDCERNPQMLTYALGLRNGGTLKHLAADHALVITVVQPRRRDGRPAEDSWEGQISEIGLHAISVAGAISNARKPSPLFLAGDHCRWCKAKGKCPQQHAEAIKGFEIIDAKEQPITDPAFLTPTQMSQILDLLPTMKAWLKAVEARALAEPPPGWKLVQGKSNRKWSEGAEKVLAKAGNPEVFYERSLIGITDAVKQLKLLGMSKLESELFIKPDGKPTLARESDPRPPITMIDGFTTVDDE